MNSRYSHAYIGYLAIIILLIGQTFQIKLIIDEKYAGNVSYVRVITSFIVTLCWFLFGLKNNIYPLVASGAVSILYLSAIIALKEYYKP